MPPMNNRNNRFSAPRNRRSATDIPVANDTPQPPRPPSSSTSTTSAIATLKRARFDLGILSSKDGATGPWYWSLPETRNTQKLITKNFEPLHETKDLAPPRIPSKTQNADEMETASKLQEVGNTEDF